MTKYPDGTKLALLVSEIEGQAITSLRVLHRSGRFVYVMYELLCLAPWHAGHWRKVRYGLEDDADAVITTTPNLGKEFNDTVAKIQSMRRRKCIPPKQRRSE